MTRDEKREYDRARYERIKADPVALEKKRAQTAAATTRYYYRNREQQLEKLAAWRLANPEKRRAQKTRWWAKHRDRLCAKKRIKFHLNLEENRAKSRAWYRRNREYAIAKNTEWGRARPDKRAQYGNTRRARKRVGGETHTLAQWIALKIAHRGACFYCDRTDRLLTRDHVMPLARGGSDAISNIVPACRRCNCSKHTSTLEEFLVRRYAT